MLMAAVGLPIPKRDVSGNSPIQDMLHWGYDWGERVKEPEVSTSDDVSQWVDKCSSLFCYLSIPIVFPSLLPYPLFIASDTL